MECNSTACVGAKADVQASRANMARLCSGFKIVLALANFFSKLATLPNFFVIVALLLLITIAQALGLLPVSILLGVIMAVALVIFLVAYVLSLVFGIGVNQINGALSIERTALLDALARVLMNCPPECRGDLSPPPC